MIGAFDGSPRILYTCRAVDRGQRSEGQRRVQASTPFSLVVRGRHDRGRAGFWATLVVIATTLALSACGGAPSSLPGGVYTSQQYHFRVNYPSGWQVNASSQPTATAPLILIITRSGSTAIPGSLLSSLTINVLSMSDASIAKSARDLSSNSALKSITFGGQPGYRDQPTTETGSGNTSADTLTHTDYYVAHGGFLYQVSADALAGDGATVDSIAQSFTLLN